MILVNGSSQVEAENYANIETQKVANWARNNKMSFNDQKSKVMIITKKTPRTGEFLKFSSTTRNYNRQTN
jgi:hypothetical protein